MYHPLFRILTAIIFLPAVFGPPGKSATAQVNPCDPAYVSMAGSTITVAPTGTDDTANLQCALDAAVAAGARTTIRLAAGDFHTAQIVVYGFQGKFTGAGMQETRILNLLNLYVTPVDFYINPPSAENPAPFLFYFIDGDFSISQLSFHVGGDPLTTGWTIFGIDPPVKELAAAVVVEGTHAVATIDHVLVEGEPAEGTLMGYSLINGIYFEGFIGETPPPVSGSFQVTHSIIRSVGSGTPVTNLADASVLLSHNVYEDVVIGMEGSDLINSSYEASFNKVSALYAGVNFYSMFNPADIGTSLLVKNNHFLGLNGVVFTQTWGDGNSCLIANNNTKQLTGEYVTLGDTVICEVK